MLLQLKSGCCVERIQLGTCTRSLNVFESILLKEIKWNWAPSAADNAKMCALQCTFPITVSFEQQKAQMWLLCECAEDAVMCCSSVPLVQAQCLLASPAIPVSCWKPRSPIPDAGPEPAQRRKWPLGTARSSSVLACCSRQAQSGRDLLAFLPMLWGAQGLGWLVTQAAHCLPMSLIFIAFCHRSSTMFWLFSLFYKWEMPHNEHGDIYSSSFLVLDFLLLKPNCEEKAPGDQAMQ